MLRHLAVSSLAVVGLLTVATAPAEARRRTGTWKYWNPYMAHVAPPPHWHKPYGGGYAGRGYGHPGYQGYRGGYGGYSPPPYGHAYGPRRHVPGW
jgi:hypothetical protein